jgi:phage tail-like protein
MMKEQEFKKQVFKTTAQWGSGLFDGLEILEDGGCTLPSVPVVSTKIDPVAGIETPVALAADCCGILYILDSSTHQVYKCDTATGVSERIFCPKYLDKPWRMVIAGKRLWTADAAHGEIRACSLAHLQTILSIDLLEQPVDIAVNGEGDLYSLDGKTKLLYRFDRRGSLIGSFGKPYLKGPVSIAVGKEDILYIADKGPGKFLMFSKDGEYRGAGGDFSGTGMPVILIGDAKGGGFMVTDAGEVHRFDEAGISIGKIRFPEDAGPVVWITTDGCGKLYASTGKGIYILVSEKALTGKNAYYYSKTLDSGTAGNRWHRLVMKADIPPDTAVDIYSYASDDEALKNLVDGTLTDPSKTAQEKASFFDSVIPWTGPEKNGTDMLFQVKAGRFLWIKLSLATFDETARPAVREMKILYPRISYLRYLPAIYQEDPASKDFLERFLSLFESLLNDLEVDISQVIRYFDPDTTPPEFLRWLASWVDIVIEEDWREETKRRFIREAARLYAMKGTVAGISRFVELYTGKTPVILEHALAGNPVVLGGQFRLGINAMIVKTPVRGVRLGDDSILGRVALRDVVYAPEEPFLSSAYRFTVLVDLTGDERERYEKGLQMIIAEGKPAHTAYGLRFAGGLAAGADSYIGISSVVGGYEPIRVGSSIVGGGLLSSEDVDCGMVEGRAVIGKDTRLS